MSSLYHIPQNITKSSWPLVQATMKCFRQLLVISSLFVLAQSHPPFSADDCLFYLPLTNSSCVVYNFQDIATAGPYKISTPEYSYIIGLCGNISSSAMPAQCNASGPAVAYQYNSTSCYALGIANNESTYVVSQGQDLLSNSCHIRPTWASFLLFVAVNIISTIFLSCSIQLLLQKIMEVLEWSIPMEVSCTAYCS